MYIFIVCYKESFYAKDGIEKVFYKKSSAKKYITKECNKIVNQDYSKEEITKKIIKNYEFDFCIIRRKLN